MKRENANIFIVDRLRRRNIVVQIVRHKIKCKNLAEMILRFAGQYCQKGKKVDVKEAAATSRKAFGRFPWENLKAPIPSIRHGR